MATKVAVRGIVKVPWGNGGHRYKLDGEWAKGVTTLIGAGIPKEALNAWYARMVAEYVADNLEEVAGMDWMSRDQIVAELKVKPNEIRDAAGERGREIHLIADGLMRGEKVSYDPSLEGYVRSCTKFLDDYEPRPIRNETVVASRLHSFCGTFDTVAETDSEGVSIWDYKSGNGVYEEGAIQLGGYFGAEVFADEQEDGSFVERPMKSLGIENGRIVHLRPDGYDVWPVNNLAFAFECFLIAAETARMRDRIKKEGLLGVPLLPPVHRLGGVA